MVIPKWLIYYLLWVISPVESALVRRRVSPNTLTSIGLLVSLAAGVALALGRFGIGGWLYLFVGIIDLFDGRVARATGRVSRSGGFFDSIADRYSEAAVFFGLLVFYRRSWVALLVVCALFGSLMVSFLRARAEANGIEDAARVGAMQRPERIFLLGTALAASPFVAALVERAAPPRFLLTVVALGWIAVASQATALWRARDAMRKLEARRAPEAVRAARIGRAR